MTMQEGKAPTHGDVLTAIDTLRAAGAEVKSQGGVVTIVLTVEDR
jgi:hypothetical protein